VNGDIVPLEVSEGDTIVFAKGAGKKVTDEDNDYVILSEEEILAIIN
jgi:chaperonin GroES